MERKKPLSYDACRAIAKNMNTTEIGRNCF